MTTTQMTEVIDLVRSQASRLRDYLAELDDDAWRKRSACEAWRVADVVAHLVQGADTWTDAINRALAGDSGPPAGQSFLAPGERGSEGTAQRAIAFSESSGHGVLEAFSAGYDRLHQVLSGFRADDWDKPCFHRRGVVPLSDYVTRRLQELAIHGWDIRSGLDPAAELWEEPLPLLVGLVPRWLNNAFSPVGLPTPMRYRFEIPAPVTVRQDVLVNHDSFQIEPVGDAQADVTFHCDTGSYILLIFGRLNADMASVSGKLRIEGKREQATLFTTWFRGF